MTPRNRIAQDPKFWLPMVAAAFMAFGLMLGYQFNPGNQSHFSLLEKSEINTNSSNVSSVGRIEEILRFIENSYVDSIDNQKLMESAIKDVLADLDPFSSYITESELQEYNDQLDGYFRGIGINYIQFNDSIFITSVIKDGPAARAGMGRGDVIIKIKEEVISGAKKDISEIREILLDNESKFQLTLYSAKADEIITRELEIEKIVLNTSDVIYEIEEGIVYLKIKRFSSNTYRQFMEALETLEDLGASFDLVLDLRDNPGGYLPETIKILSQLITDKQKLLTYTEGQHRKRRDYKSTGQNFYNIGKIVCLINEYSASGSEIIAGALQDWDRAVIIGSPSYGKGLVQEIHTLKNGGALRLTVARYMTPTGRSIQKPYELQDNTIDLDNNQEKYASLKYGRELEGGGGITPDILMTEEDQFSSCPDFEFEHIYAHLLKSFPLESPYSDEADFLANFNITTSDFEDYSNFFNTLNPVVQVPESCLDFFQFLTKSMLAEVWYNDVTYNKVINQDDPIILKAIETIQDENLQVLLTK